ncbi:hypothetical protein F4810DRAFT_723754 [Camillea tinctor]|nr:hypothetical protein F4810DRAFT_723754 [Camillea tinctor]
MESCKPPYLLFKETQRDFTTWLVETAEKHGETVNFVPGDEHGSIRQVQIRHLLRLALTVARNGIIPIDKIQALQGIIALLQPLVNLQIVLKVLRGEPYRSSSRSQSPSLVAATESEGKSRQRSPSKQTVPHSYNMSNLENEAHFAWAVFLQDVSTIRNKIKDLWDDYIHECKSLVIAALMTNTALELLRSRCQAQVKATESLPNAPNEAEAVDWFFAYVRRRSDDGHNRWETPHFDLAIEYCYEAFYHIRDVMSHMKPSSVCLPPSVQSLTGPGALLSVPTDTPPVRFVSDLAWSYYMIPQLNNFKILGIKKNFCPGLDEITKGWGEYLDGKDVKVIPLWIGLSYQIMLDIRNATHGNIEKAFEELVRIGNLQVVGIQAYFQEENDEEDEDPNLEHLQVICHINNYVANDSISKFARENGEYQLGSSGSAEYRHWFMKNHPLLCGMQAYWLQQRWREFEFDSFSLYDSIIPAANIYNAMRINELVES